MPLDDTELQGYLDEPVPEPTTMQSMLGRKSFIGRAGEALSRPTNFALSLFKALPKAISGNTRDTAELGKSGLSGLPGLATGAVDVVGERFGAPSLQDYVDKKVGFDPEANRVTGQDVLKEFGAIKKASNPLLSPQGAAGFALEVLADPLHIPAVAKTVGKPLEIAGEAASKLIPKGFKRGPIEAASAAAERTKQVIQKEGLTEEALRRALMDDPANVAAKSQLDEITGKYGAPGVQREKILRGGEQKMGQNVGTGSLQITPENENFFNQVSQNPEQLNKVIVSLNDTLKAAGKPVLDLSADGHVNRLKHALDASGLRPEKLNDIFEAVTGARPITEDAITQARMRMFQHAHAAGLNKFSEDIVKSGTGYTQAVAPTNLHPTGKPDVSAFYVDDATRRYVVNGLTHNGAPVVFPNVEDAVRAAQVFQDMRPDTVGKVTAGEKLLDVYDEVNKLYRYGVTQPFPQYAIMNKMTNRMNANLAGDVPVIGKHYDIANAIMGGKGVDQVYELGGKQLKGADLIKMYETHGPALPNINPAIGDVARLEQPGGRAMNALQTVGKPLERASAGYVGALSSPTGLGPAALKGKVTNQMLEESDRFGIFIHGLMQGMDPASAMRKADLVLGNQSASAMTPLERQWGNRAALFYNYTRNTIPIMAKAFVEKPGQFNAILKADRQRKEQEPSYLRDGISIDVPGPGSTLSNIPNPIENLTKQFGGDSPLSMLAPPLKVAVEKFTGQSTLTGRPLTPKAPNYLPTGLTQNGETALPGLTQMGMEPQNQNLLLNNLPISRALSLANYAKKPETTYSDLALNAASGMKVQRFDPESTNLYNEAEAHKTVLDSYLKTGAVKKTPYGYALNPAILMTLPPEQMREVAGAYGKYTKLSQAASKVRKANQAKP